MQRADERKYHYIYKITRDDGKYYIGLHSTDDLDDGYFGSGQRITRSIKKYGKEKHHKEILEFLPNREMLKLREKEIVCEELLTDPLCMNLCLGGQGNPPRGDPALEPFWQNISEKLKAIWADPTKKTLMSQKVTKWWTEARKAEQSALKKKQYESQELRAKIGEASKKVWGDNSLRADQRQRKITHWQDQEYREKTIAAQNAGKQTVEFKSKQRQAKLGPKNPNYGTRWIHNPELKCSKRIPKNEPTPFGWVDGRKIYNVL